MGLIFYSDGVCGSNTELNTELNMLIYEDPPFFICHLFTLLSVFNKAMHNSHHKKIPKGIIAMGNQFF